MAAKRPCTASRAEDSLLPVYSKGASFPPEEEEKGLQKIALFWVTGMTCSACAGSVEKAVKHLPGIKQAVVDVLNNRAQVTFYSSLVNVSRHMTRICIE